MKPYHLVVGGIALFIGMLWAALAGAALLSPEMRDALGSGSHLVARHPRLVGAVLLLGSSTLAWQLWFTASRGFVYSGRPGDPWVIRSRDPGTFRFWVGIHGLFVAAPAIWAMVLFLV